MIYEVIWHPNAEISLQDELSYILMKWNEKEVIKFYNLVLENLDRLAINPEIGRFENELKVYTMLISKQTTLYYEFDSVSGSLYLLLFWNNQRNPSELKSILEK